MKKQAYTMIALIVLVGSMAVAAQAQSGGRTELVANIPFEFNVGHKTLPAGEYLLQSVGAESANVVVKILSRDGKASAMIQMDSVIGKAQESAKLIFRHYGNKYFFAEAWVDGDSSGLRATKSRSERTVERELPGTKPGAETVALKTR